MPMLEFGKDGREVETSLFSKGEINVCEKGSFNIPS
jgi:hypothetical protein